MYALYVLGFVMLVVLLGSSTTEDRLLQRQAQEAALARQMIVQHHAAQLTCAPNPTACSGTVDVAARLPADAQGAPAYQSGNIRTVGDGTGLIVTVFVPMVNNADLVSGRVAAALVKDSESPFTTGSYDFANQRVGAPGPTVGGTPRHGLAVPRGIGGVTLRDRLPIIATDLTP